VGSKQSWDPSRGNRQVENEEASRQERQAEGQAGETGKGGKENGRSGREKRSKQGGNIDKQLVRKGGYEIKSRHLS
jgi:hypothetical protein